MSGLEVVLAIAAIVQGFEAGHTLFRRWRARQAKRRLARSEETELELQSSGPAVWREYDRDFARLGERFAVGDEIGRAELQTYLITLQQSIIGLLEAAVTGGLNEINLAHVLQTSRSVHNGSIRALSEQFQRMSTASLVPQPLSKTASQRARIYQSFCTFALCLQKTGVAPHPRDVACPDCPWGHRKFPPYENKKAYEFGVLIAPQNYVVFLKSQTQPVMVCFDLPHRFFLKSHLQVYDGVHNRRKAKKRTDPVYGCILCERRGDVSNFQFRYTAWNDPTQGLVQHIEADHFAEECDEEIDMVRRVPLPPREHVADDTSEDFS